MLFVIILGRNSTQCIRTIFYNCVNCLLDETKMFLSMGSKYFNRITKIRTESLRCHTAVSVPLFCTEAPCQLSILIEPFFINFFPSFQMFSCPWNHRSPPARHVLPLSSRERGPASISLVLPAQSKPGSWYARTDCHILLYLCRAVGSPQPPSPFRILCSFLTDFYIWHCRYISHSKE